MNDAESAPSPKRFWRRLGILNAAMNASAAIPVVAPGYGALTDWPTPPSSLDARIPAATSAAAPPVPRGFVGTLVRDVDAVAVTRAPRRPRDQLRSSLPARPRVEWPRCASAP